MLEATEEHPFWVVDKGWVEAKDLVESDVFVNGKNELISIESIKVRKTDGTQIFNISVEKNHNYFVSDQNILTHNKNCIVTKNIFNKGKLVESELKKYLKLIKDGKVSKDDIIEYQKYLKDFMGDVGSKVSKRIDDALKVPVKLDYLTSTTAEVSKH